MTVVRTAGLWAVVFLLGLAALAQTLYAAAGEPRELWLVTGAGHGDAAQRQPDEYERRLVGALL